jgi:hypothetical protein
VIDQEPNYNVAEVTAPTPFPVELTGVFVGPAAANDERDGILGVVAAQTFATIVVESNSGAVTVASQPSTTVVDGKITLNLVINPDGFGTVRIRTILTDSGSNNNNSDPDRNDNTRTMDFNIVIGQVNSPPTLSDFAPLQIDQNATGPIVGFTVGDAPGETLAANLIVTAATSDPTLIPPQVIGTTLPDSGGILLGGSGASRSIQVKPAPNRFGTATISVTVTDSGLANGTGQLSTTKTFQVTVVQREQKPQIVSITPDPLVTPVNTESDIATVVIFDQETAAGALQLTVQTISNPALVRSVQFGGSGGNRLMIVIPASNQTGEANITLRVTDAAGEFTDKVFRFVVLTPNLPPTFTTPPVNQTISGGASSTQNFVVADTETASGFIIAVATSSNQALIPNANIIVQNPPDGGLSGGNRRITVSPAANQTGTSTITVTIHDGPVGGANTRTAVATFVVTVQSSNLPPNISDIVGPINTTENVPTAQIPFLISDDQTAFGFLELIRASSNPTVVPVSGIILGGAANSGSRNVIVNPAANQSGFSDITITVRDAGGLTDSTTFRVNVTPAPKVGQDDFSGDGKSDIIYQDGPGFLGLWAMNKEVLIAASLLNPNHPGVGWRVVGNADFNADGKQDLLLQHTPSGDIAVWIMNGTTLVTPVFITPRNPGAGWRLVDAADFNGDGKPDLLFQHTTGTLVVWYLNGTTLTVPTEVNPNNPGAGWTAAAAADINGDGNADIVFQHTDGTIAVWYLFGVDLLSPNNFNPANPGAVWRVVGSTDLDGDGRVDLILRNSTTTELVVWYLNNVDLIIAKALVPGTAGGTWAPAAP